MVSTPNAAGGSLAASNNPSTRNSPTNGLSSSTLNPKTKERPNVSAPHVNGVSKPLSAMHSLPLDLTSVERRGQPNAVREPTKPKQRPHGIEEAPTYTPTEEEFQDPLEYIKKIAPEASKYGICKVIPPDSWNPEFAIDTERFHFRTRKQELNSVEGSTRANLTYLDGLVKYHKQQGSNLHRLPYVDKKPLDLYRLKKSVESRGGFEKVCKLKKWAEIGRDLGYSGKIMSSLSTSLKNSYQKWLCPYEDYLRLAKPGVHQQLEAEYGGPLTPSPAVTPAKRSTVNTPTSMRIDSPARNATDALQAGINGVKLESHDTPMTDAPSIPDGSSRSGFQAINSGFTSVNRPKTRDSQSFTPEPSKPKQNGSPATFSKDSSETAANLEPAAAFKRGLGIEPTPGATDGEDDGSNRRSKRLKKDAAPTVAGSYMSQLKPSAPRFPREEPATDEKCLKCGRVDEPSQLLVCESCDNAYHGQCLDPPVSKVPADGEWNCPRCLVGDGQFGFEEGGLYSLKQFQQKANDFKQGYFENKLPFDHTLNCHRPITEEDVEAEFWRLVTDLEETIEVEYGADIHCTTHGSGFPTLEKHPNSDYAADTWNLNVMPFHPESLFRHIKTDISGMTVPWVYVGMIFSTFCWHNEDHYAYSTNYQHFGATKTWYGIPGDDAEKFEDAMRATVPELFETQPDLLFQLVTLLTPEQLKKADVRVYAVDQRAGQFVITFPQAYHAGFNHGFNFNEAVNFAPSDWEPYGLSGVERLQQFRRQPCFSHDELLWTASEGQGPSGLTIQTAKWLAPALLQVQQREFQQRQAFKSKHLEIADHKCEAFTDGHDPCPLSFQILDEEVQDEEEQCCAYCKTFAYFSRFKCLQTGKVLCLTHAGEHACCEQPETDRWMGRGHVLIFRKSDEQMENARAEVAEKAKIPEQWNDKYYKLLEEEPRPPLKALRSLLNEGERIQCDIEAIPILKEFVDRCNDWVDEATTYLVRKQQNRRKSEKAAPSRKSSGPTAQNQNVKDKETRSVDNIHRLLREAEHIGFDCPEITQLSERSEAIKSFQERTSEALSNKASMSADAYEELLEEGRGFNVDIAELDTLARLLEQMQWDEKASASRKLHLSLSEVEELIEEGQRLEVPSYNDHLQFFDQQVRMGRAWEGKANELINADFVHFPQLEALSQQVQTNGLPVTKTTLDKIDRILLRQREAHKKVMEMTERCRQPEAEKRPFYHEVVEMMKDFEELHSKPHGTIDLENEKKRHEDWMRKGKKLFGKSNAPLHILGSHLEYVLKRNETCFDLLWDRPRRRAEPESREPSPVDDLNPESGRNRQVFCICRKPEAGMMIECELCHEWYHYKCLKIARGKVKEDDKYTCPICDWRMKIPRDASRPKIEDLEALYDEINDLPFQPDEQDTLSGIIEQAREFRDYLGEGSWAAITTHRPLDKDLDEQRFYLRKLEGAEVLLSTETNSLRQQMHKWLPVAPDPPPLQEVSLSTRKPRPTKLMKMLAEYGVDNPDDLPEHAKGKANSLRRKAANAEAAATTNSVGGSHLNYAGDDMFSRAPGADMPGQPGSSHGNPPLSGSAAGDPMEIDGDLGAGPLGIGGPQLQVDNAAMSLEERILHGSLDEADLESEEYRTKTLEILSRTEEGRQQAERIFGPDCWGSRHKSMSDPERSITPAVAIDPMMKHEDDGGDVDQMFKEMVNHDEDDDHKKDDQSSMLDPSLKTEHNGL